MSQMSELFYMRAEDMYIPGYIYSLQQKIFGREIDD